MVQKSKQIVSGVLLVIFAAYYVNISFFTHSHIINGTTIVHSHIHTKAHAQKGTHSESEVTLIAALSAFQASAAALFFASAALFLLATLPTFFAVKNSSAIAYRYVSLRAPPFAAGC